MFSYGGVPPVEICRWEFAAWVPSDMAAEHAAFWRVSATVPSRMRSSKHWQAVTRQPPAVNT